MLLIFWTYYRLFGMCRIRCEKNKNKIQSDLKIQYEIVCLRGALPFKTKFL